jgi:hypothetical protein
VNGFDRRPPSGPAAPAKSAQRLCHCSFCGRGQHEVWWMLAGPHPVFICDSCVGEAAAQIAKIRAEQAPSPDLGVDT